jgi:hypothetical protein
MTVLQFAAIHYPRGSDIDRLLLRFAIIQLPNSA